MARPVISFSDEARALLLRVTYGRSMPSEADPARIPVIMWTFGTTETDRYGQFIKRRGPCYQLFVDSRPNLKTDIIGKLEDKKDIAIYLDPRLTTSNAYKVDLSGQLIQIEPTS